MAGLYIEAVQSPGGEMCAASIQEVRQLPGGGWAYLSKRIICYTQAPDGSTVEVPDLGANAKRMDGASQYCGKRSADEHGEGDRHPPPDGRSRKTKRPRRSGPTTAVTDASKTTIRLAKTRPKLWSNVDRARCRQVRVKYMKNDGQSVDWERAIRDQKKVLEKARQEEKQARRELKEAKKRKKKDRRYTMKMVMGPAVETQPGQPQENRQLVSLGEEFPEEQNMEMDTTMWWMPEAENLDAMSLDLNALELPMDLGLLELPMMNPMDVSMSMEMMNMDVGALDLDRWNVPTALEWSQEVRQEEG